MKSVFYALPFFCCIYLQSQTLSAQAGSLDPSFGDGGVLVSDILWKGNFRILPDGKVLTGGIRKVNGSVSNTDLLVGRLLEDGSPDLSFGDNGQTILDFNNLPMGMGNFEEYASLITLNDGKIVVCGLKGSYFSVPGQALVAVLQPNGMPDTTFGQMGKRLFGFDGFIVESVGLGRFSNDDFLLWVVLSIEGSAENSHLALLRFNADGSFDPTFGSNGDGMLIKMVGPASPFLGTLRKSYLKIAPDDKIVLCGTASSYEIATNRYNSDGSDDVDFGLNGQTITHVGLFVQVEDLAVQPDGKIIAFGHSLFAGEPVFTIVRLNTNGDRDIQWGQDGVLIHDVGDYDNLIKTGAVQNDGKIVAVGERIFSDGNEQWVITRYNADGSLDNIFGVEGIQGNDFGEGDESPLRMAISSDHSIYVSGSIYSNGESYWMMAKYFAGEYVGTHLPMPRNEILNTSLYPNPIERGWPLSLRYELTKPSQISAQLIDSKGVSVQNFFSSDTQVKGAQCKELQLSNDLLTGIYHLVLNTDDGLISLPFFLKK